MKKELKSIFKIGVNYRERIIGEERKRKKKSEEHGKSSKISFKLRCSRSSEQYRKMLIVYYITGK